jgi:selenide,water dikinase
VTSLPLLAGAAEAIRAGIVSSLHSENVRLRHALQKPDQADPILFDPQTAGGLLAGIPASNADSCVSELKQLGYSSASIIGNVVAAEEGRSSVSVTSATRSGY